MKFWQLSDEDDKREETSILIPETPYIKTFLRTVIKSLTDDLDVDKDIVAKVASGPLSHLLVKEEVVADLDEELVDAVTDLAERELNNNNNNQDDDEVEEVDANEDNVDLKQKRKIVDEEEEEVLKMKKRKTRVLKPKSGPNDPRKCKQCRNSLEDDFEDHICVRNFECGECGKRFITKQDLNVHALIHSNLKPHECGRCNQSFRHIQTLRRHEFAVHSTGAGKKRFKCEECDKSFSLRQGLVRHVKTLHDAKSEKVICPVCGIPFGNSANLRKHSRLKHENEANFVCEKCGEKFIQRYYMERHKQYCNKMYD